MKKILVSTGGFGPFQTFVNDSNWIKQESNKYVIDFHKSTSINSDERVLSMHPRLRGKIPKMLIWEYFPNYDYYIWIDSVYQILDKTSIERLVDECLDVDACFFHHNLRKSVKEEVDEMEMLVDKRFEYFTQRYDGEPMGKQYESYRKDDEWNDNFLLECGAFIYSNKVVENINFNLMKEWFYHNCIWTIQDQISLPYLIHKFKTKYKILSGSVWENDYFIR